MEKNSTAPETTTIDMTPPGLQTPEGIARVARTQTEWEHLTAEVANRLTQIWKGSIGFHAFMDADEVKEIDDLIQRRATAQDQFLLALGGRE